jgi:hypothetical protein
MTHTPHDHALAPSSAARIAAELAALGEEPADRDELAFAAAAAVAVPDDVRTVATLVALSTWVAPAEELLPLARHRVWRRVAARAMATPASAPPLAPAANGPAGWRGVVASLALVASVTILLHVDVAPPPTAEDRAALASMGEATRAVLESTLPGAQDGARARALAEGYAERLAASSSGRGSSPPSASKAARGAER